MTFPHYARYLAQRTGKVLIYEYRTPGRYVIRVLHSPDGETFYELIVRNQWTDGPLQVVEVSDPHHDPDGEVVMICRQAGRDEFKETMYEFYGNDFDPESVSIVPLPTSV